MHEYSTGGHSHISCCRGFSWTCHTKKKEPSKKPLRTTCIMIQDLSVWVAEYSNYSAPSLLAAINHYGVVVTARNHVLAIGREIDAVDAVCVLSEHFRYAKRAKNFVSQLHVRISLGDKFYSGNPSKKCCGYARGAETGEFLKPNSRKWRGQLSAGRLATGEPRLCVSPFSFFFSCKLCFEKQALLATNCSRFVNNSVPLWGSSIFKVS